MQGKLLTTCIIALLITITPSLSYAGRPLEANELKTLITDKTVHVLRLKDGAKWVIYFASDGKGYNPQGKALGIWEVNLKGEHCTSWARLKCARVVDHGDGTYSRLKPNGAPAATWIKVLNEKPF